MYIRNFALAAIFPALLVGCGSSGGGGSNIRPDTPAPVVSSLSGVPVEYRAAVEAAKTFNPTAVLAGDLMDDQGMVIKQITVNGQVLQSGEYSFSELQNGLSNLAINVDYGDAADNLSDATAKGNLYIYQQPYSVVIGGVFTQDSGPFVGPGSFGVHYVDDIKGLNTASTVIDNLAAEGTFTYTGVAFNGQGVGNLTYGVDFAARTGSGQITGLLETGTINLQTAGIADLNLEFVKGMGIAGKADFANDPGKDINYQLGFFGPNAEEIAGKTSYQFDADNTAGISEVGFGGKR